MAALRRFNTCAHTDLRNILDKLLAEVPRIYNCYVKFFDEHDKGNPTESCGKVKIPTFFQSTDARGVDAKFGLPNCVTDMSSYVEYDFAPISAYDLKKCKKEIDVFIGEGTASYLLTSGKSAQSQYDSYVSNLHDEINRKLDEAASKFNCKAEGGRIC